MLGLRRPAPVIPLMEFLASRRLSFHTQIVLCPGWNDGPALERSIEDLAAFHPWMGSLAIVPVGLTRHRRGLPRLRPVTPALARRTLDETAPLRRRLARRLGEDAVFFSDEFYLAAGLPVPDYRRRDYRPQIENGVGMVREFYKGFRPSGLPRRLAASASGGGRVARRVGLVTGALGEKVLERLLAELNRVEGLEVRPVIVPNRLFGASVTVSGLLGGADIARALRARRRDFDRFVLPSNCLRYEGDLFLDDWTLERLERAVGRAVRVASNRAADAARACLER
jgi:putative radical SAM enzyme (TIGR03279 family)